MLSDNRYRYNEKEEQSFINIPYIDYGARMYDPKFRLSWNGSDPLAEKYYMITRIHSVRIIRRGLLIPMERK